MANELYLENIEWHPEVIEKVRRIKGISKAAIARAIGLAYTTYDGYETGRRMPKFWTMVDIADLLDIPLEDLIGLEAAEKFREYINRDMPQKSIMTRRPDLEEKMLANYEKFHGQEAQRREALLSHYDRLNDDGQEKAVERVSELAEVPRYQKKTRNPLNA